MKKVKMSDEEALMYSLRYITQDNQKKRLLVLRRLFDLSVGVPCIVSVLQFCEYTGMEEYDVMVAAKYLAEEGLLTLEDEVSGPVTPGPYLCLTHKGIVEVEQSITEPTKATEHFPAPVVQHIQNFNASVGAVQTGPQSTAHAVQHLGSELPEVFRLTARLRRGFNASPSDVREAAWQLVDGLEEEFRLSQPRAARVRAFLNELAPLADGPTIKATLTKLARRCGAQL